MIRRLLADLRWGLHVALCRQCADRRLLCRRGWEIRPREGA